MNRRRRQRWRAGAPRSAIAQLNAPPVSSATSNPTDESGGNESDAVVEVADPAMAAQLQAALQAPSSAPPAGDVGRCGWGAKSRESEGVHSMKAAGERRPAEQLARVQASREPKRTKTDALRGRPAQQHPKRASSRSALHNGPLSLRAAQFLHSRQLINPMADLEAWRQQLAREDSDDDDGGLPPSRGNPFDNRTSA